jgi:hypothetical protein
MKADQIITHLLLADAGVSALIGTRLDPVELQQGTELPALVVRFASGMPGHRPVDQAAQRVMPSRIQVAAVAATYDAVQQLLLAVRDACDAQRGTIDGVYTHNVRFELLGPPLKTPDSEIYEQSIDFMVTVREGA